MINIPETYFTYFIEWIWTFFLEMIQILLIEKPNKNHREKVRYVV
jgi:hypothetical protein